MTQILPIQKLLLLLIAIVYSLPVLSQWTVLNSGVTNTLRAPYFTNSKTGYVVGEPISPGQAVILKTTDGGDTWVSKVSGTVNALRGVHFTDDNTGYAVGFTGTILKTTNAGETWTPLTSGTTQALRSVHFPSANVGYVAGGAGVILKTTNGGTTWTSQNSTITQDLINIRFISDDIGYAVSSTGTFTGGIVIKTVNGGATWTAVYTNNYGLLGLAVVNANTVYAGGGNNQGVGGSSYIVKTTNGGTTWTQVYTGLSNAALRGAWFTSANKGWFVGDYGEVPVTADGGLTWGKDSVQLQGLLGIFFPNEKVGYAVGAAGVILKYNLVSDCPKPTGLNVTNITSSSATLGWNEVAGASGYKIIYHPENDPAGIKKSSTSNSKVLTGLLPNTTYKWTLQTVCSSPPLVASAFVKGNDFTTLPQKISGEEAVDLSLQLFPNPASDEVTISFNVSYATPVSIQLLDLNGKLLREEEQGTFESGRHLVNFDCSRLSSGLYFIQIRTNESVSTNKLQVER